MAAVAAAKAPRPVTKLRRSRLLVDESAVAARDVEDARAAPAVDAGAKALAPVAATRTRERTVDFILLGALKSMALDRMVCRCGSGHMCGAVEQRWTRRVTYLQEMVFRTLRRYHILLAHDVLNRLARIAETTRSVPYLALSILPTMHTSKASLALALVALSGANAFSFDVSDRRAFAQSVASTIAGVATVTTVAPGPASATEKWVYDNAKEVVVENRYKPKFDDLNQIYGLGKGLEKLEVKVSSGDDEQLGKALDGLRAFNKDPNFYPGFAKNYISKVVKRSAADDERIGYVKEAATLVSSCEGLLRGEEAGLSGADAAKEATTRVKKAESLIAKFLDESGVEDERVAAYVAAH